MNLKMAIIAFITVNIIILTIIIMIANVKCSNKNDKYNSSNKLPNIVMFIADDLGWADVSYNYKHEGKAPFQTKNIDTISSQPSCKRFESMYTAALCTPSRAALFSGRYPFRLGLPGPFLGDSPCGINTTKTGPLLPEVLKKWDYKSYLVGKWHLGFSHPSQTPIGIGFDRFIGGYHGGNSYWNKSPMGNTIDLHNDTRNEDGSLIFDNFFDATHLTDLTTREALNFISSHRSNPKTRDKPYFLVVSYNAPHSPLQPHPRHLPACDHISNNWRKNFCGLVQGLDEGIGEIVNQIGVNASDDDDDLSSPRNIVIFTSDNGGQPIAGGFNAPFRGTKSGIFEGSVRVPSFACGIWNSSLNGSTSNSNIKSSNNYYSKMAHVTDWFPTLINVIEEQAQLSSSSSSSSTTTTTTTATTKIVVNELNLRFKLDGHDLREESRNSIILALDTVSNITSYRKGQYKISFGRTGDRRTFYEPSGTYILENHDYLFTKNFIVAFVADRITELFGLMIDRSKGPDRAYLAIELIFDLRFRFERWWSFDDNDIFLFDIINDPLELKNLAYDSNYSELVQSMVSDISSFKSAMTLKPCDYFCADPTTRDKKNCLIFKGKPIIDKGENYSYYQPWIPMNESADERMKICLDVRIEYYDLFKEKVTHILYIAAIIILSFSFIVIWICRRKQSNHSHHGDGNGDLKLKLKKEK